MGQVRICQLDDAREFAAMRDFFEHDNPGIKLDLALIDGETTLRTRDGGMRVFWIFRGEGEVFLPSSYRTQEGDGQPLPAEYKPDRIDSDFAATLASIKENLATLTDAALVGVRAILSRWHGGTFVGDFSGELWKLDHLPRPWARDPRVKAILQSLFTTYRDHGHSTKQLSSWEPIIQGDQLIAAGDQELRVRGHFACLTMENIHRPSSHISAARRLRYLADTAGGCNPDFDPFRRLPLTWCYNYPGESGDGLNWVNSHVVNIPSETSPAHFHPSRAIGPTGGAPQREMYLVLDPAAYRLSTAGREAALLIFPDLRDLRQFQRIALIPGMFIYIPPGTGHRGLDVFANILTLPGFKPHNEYYIDRDIHDTAHGAAPFNAAMLPSKNYARIEDFL